MIRFLSYYQWVISSTFKSFVNSTFFSLHNLFVAMPNCSVVYGFNQLLGAWSSIFPRPQFFLSVWIPTVQDYTVITSPRVDISPTISSLNVHNIAGGDFVPSLIIFFSINSTFPVLKPVSAPCRCSSWHCQSVSNTRTLLITFFRHLIDWWTTALQEAT